MVYNVICTIIYVAGIRDKNDDCPTVLYAGECRILLWEQTYIHSKSYL